MNAPKAIFFYCRLFLLLLLPVVASAETRFETLEAGERVYRDVRVREVSAKWLVILHSGGIAQVPLSDLPADLQARFGYDSQRAREFEEELRKKRETASQQRRVAAPPRVEDFSRNRETRPEVDLRPRYFELGIYTKDQGRRPSCAVFAILSVLEFHYSARKGSALLLSEEFLVWATRQINPDQADFDGFSFGEVLAAIHRFGVARGDALSNTLGVPVNEIVASEPAKEDALTRRDVLTNVVFGSNEAKLEAIVRELNEGYPVAVSMAWPPNAVMARVHTLRDQSPRAGAGHAVTIVGYQENGDKAGGRLFLFRNSYGPRWGVNGYGYVADSYLKEHLRDVVSFRLRDM